MTAFTEEALTGDLQGVLLRPAARSDLGVVVLGGSSGRVDTARAALFAQRGALTFAQRWFGGEGQSPGICEIPLETFGLAVDRLVAEGCKRIALVGTSKSGEGGLLAAAFDPRIDVVVAFSPSSVVWAQTGPGRDGQEWPLRSSWTWGGVPLPFVPYDVAWWLEQKPQPPIAFRPYHEQSLRAFAEAVPAATIPVEKIRGRIVLVGGGADALWPSDVFAREVAARLAAHGKSCDLVIHPDAGHRVVLPGEALLPRPAARDWGGSDEADVELGTAAWKAIARALDLGG